VLAAARRATIEATAARVVSTLREAGARCLLLKGPSLAELYDGARHYADVDLFVEPRSLDLAERVLGELGFRLRHDDPHSRIWGREGVDVDLHTTIVGVGVAPQRLWDVWSEHSESLVLRGVRVETLDRPARVLHVALHAAQHGVNEPKPREDLRRALERMPREVWVDAAQLAAELDAEAALSAGLDLEPAGRELRQSLPIGAAARRTETELRASTAPPTSVGLLRLAETKGLRAKASLVWRELFPSAAFMRTWTPLAARGRVGLALAYAWRPVWMLLQLGPALRAIMRARRAAARR